MAAPLDWWRAYTGWFRAENTAMGRRANEHRRTKRIALGLPPPWGSLASVLDRVRA